MSAEWEELQLRKAELKLELERLQAELRATEYAIYTQTCREFHRMYFEDGGTLGLSCQLEKDHEPPHLHSKRDGDSDEVAVEFRWPVPNDTIEDDE